MFKVLLVVPRFLLLDLKFLLHNHVCQHLHVENHSHAFQELFRFLNMTKSRFNAIVIKRVFPAVVCPPAAGTGVRSSPDRQTDHHWWTGAAMKTFPAVKFKIKAAIFEYFTAVRLFVSVRVLWFCLNKTGCSLPLQMLYLLVSKVTVNSLQIYCGCLFFCCTAVYSNAVLVCVLCLPTTVRHRGPRSCSCTWNVAHEMRRCKTTTNRRKPIIMTTKRHFFSSNFSFYFDEYIA